MSKLQELFQSLYENDAQEWVETASRMVEAPLGEQHQEALAHTLDALSNISKQFNHIVANMDMHNLYIAEHIYADMPVSAQKNIIDFAVELNKEPRGENNHMTNYPQYNELRVECDLFATNFAKLPSMSQHFYRESLKLYSDTILPLLHDQARSFEAEATKDLPDIKFDLE
ncbi:MAG: hypothetical protein VX740_07505 [Pseudomonadota bacterium]|jgi:hypothetical protein|nr:hypothetical protein [Pseudomonadota bacterium]MED5423270.1 hypothetical protein [Pseudomonadota bacterium]